MSTAKPCAKIRSSALLPLPPPKNTSNVDVKKSFFPKGDFGDLFRYEFESNTILATLECWSNGAVSMDIFDIDVEEQIYVIFCLPNEIDQINDNLDYFFKVLKSGN